jgi:ABC-2 type transport system ATP-binding protein
VAGGVTILLTTQYLEEADELADRIALLDQGKLVAEGTADELKRLIPGGHVRLQFTDADGLDAAARTLGEVVRDQEALSLQVPSDGSVDALRALIDRLDEAQIKVESLSVHTPDLDDVFLALTGQPKKEEAR